MTIHKIISGGQTGVDRAALDVALALNYEVGGWCPAGRLAEDGVIPERYPLQETPTSDSNERTKKNVSVADATLVLAMHGDLRGGTLFTVLCAEKLEKPIRLVTIRPLPSTTSTSQTAELAHWFSQNKVVVLNVGGPRESEQPGIYEAAAAFLRQLLR
jgi:hypothetical protein